MSVLDDILGIIDNAFALLGILDVISICGILLGNWAGIISGSATTLAIVILAFVYIIVGAVITDVLQALIDAIITAVGAVVQAIASIIEAIFSIVR
jgi:hypothetical protein